MQYFFKYVLTYFLHLNSYLVTFLHNTICRAQLFLSFSSVSFGISFEHGVQLPFTVLLYSTFPDNYAFLSLSPSQIKNTQSTDTVPVHGHSPLVCFFDWVVACGHWHIGCFYWVSDCMNCFQLITNYLNSFHLDTARFH